jgi:acetaldehyde dehydrogenase (acetylating)
MTAVVATFSYQGKLGLTQAQSLGLSFTHLGVRKIEVNEREQTISVEYDATRMDQHGVAALLRRLRIPIQDNLFSEGR